MAPSVYRITPYDPAEPPAAERHGGTAIPYASGERVAAACAEAVTGFAREAGADHLLVGSPMLEGFFSHAESRGWRGRGLTGLFPPDLSGYHDGARVPLATGLGLLRAMVLRAGAWCRLHTKDGFFLHVGQRDDIYVGGARPYPEAAARARALGLTVVPVERSPYDPALDEPDELPAADDAFWSRLHSLVAERGGVLLEERYVANAHRWHRLTDSAGIAAVRTGLAPRAVLAVWPDLTEDIDSVRATLRSAEHLVLLVQQEADGTIRPGRVAEPWMGRTDTAFPAITHGPGWRAALVPLRSAEHPRCSPAYCRTPTASYGPAGARTAPRRTNARPCCGRCGSGTWSRAWWRAAWTTSGCTCTSTTRRAGGSAS